MCHGACLNSNNMQTYCCCKLLEFFPASWLNLWFCKCTVQTYSSSQWYCFWLWKVQYTVSLSVPILVWLMCHVLSKTLHCTCFHPFNWKVTPTHSLSQSTWHAQLTDIPFEGVFVYSEAASLHGNWRYLRFYETKFLEGGFFLPGCLTLLLYSLACRFCAQLAKSIIVKITVTRSSFFCWTACKPRTWTQQIT